MFRINRKIDYSIRVMLCLDKRPIGSRLPTKSVQDEMLIPRPFLQRIIANLSHSNLLLTYPGPNGGIELARPPSKINLLQIWEATEGIVTISECIKSMGECPFDPCCPIRNYWIHLQNIITNELENITLEILASEEYSIDSMKYYRYKNF